MKLRQMVMGGALAASLVAASTAQAILPPAYYQHIRDTAPDVIVIRVQQVVEPAPAALYGICTVQGKVAKVERGTRYKVGAPVAVGVECRKPEGHPPMGASMYTELGDLKASRYGRAYLNADGTLAVSQYQLLKTLR